MTSTRLPGKVLMQVKGRPLLSYLFERLRFCGNLDRIILATTINSEDDPVVALCEKEQVLFFRGQEHDVLDRYYQAAMKYNVEHIMHITADCPLVDPQICDMVARQYEKGEADFVGTGPSFAEGMDCSVSSFEALKKAWVNARLQSEREHVMSYIINHPEIFRIFRLTNSSGDGHYRLTVDQIEDFEVVKYVIEQLYKGPERPLLIADMKLLLDKHPEIMNLNSHIIRNEGYIKSLREDSEI
jgi:spore coat polysaccharide biosynthesis protein SpsF